jgi:hypothetical protein
MKTYQLCIAIVASILILSSCNDQLPIVTDPKAQITSYHESTLKSENRNANFNKSINIYIDYSGGMFLPINQCYDLIDEIITITNKKSTVFYNVGLGEPYKIKGNILKPNHSKNPRQNSNYTDAESYLDDAIDSITNDYSSQSIFITDFELYKNGRFDPSPWATLYFENWLSKGHEIDVFAKEFTNKNSRPQYLYLILFTPQNYPTDEAVITRLKAEGYTKKTDLEWFSFSDNLGEIGQNGSYNKLIAPNQEFGSDLFAYYEFDLLGIRPVLNNAPLFKNISFKNTSQVYKDLKIDYELTDLTDSFSKKGKGENVGKNVFDIGINNNKEVYEFEVKLSDKLNGLRNQRELYRIDFYLTDANAGFNEERMDNILQWTDSNGTTFSSLNKSLQEAVTRVKLEKKLLYTYYIELSI